jgi:hypothetical protein
MFLAHHKSNILKPLHRASLQATARFIVRYPFYNMFGFTGGKKPAVPSADAEYHIEDEGKNRCNSDKFAYR